MAFPTNPIYKLITDPYSGEVESVKIKLSGSMYRQIPFVTGNTDYAEYLEWVAAGNTPEAAD